MLKFVVLFLLGTSALAVPTDTNIPGTSIPGTNPSQVHPPALAVPISTNPAGTSVPSGANQSYPPWLAVLVGKPGPSISPITNGQNRPPAWMRIGLSATASVSKSPEPSRPNFGITSTSAPTSTNPGTSGASVSPSLKRIHPNSGITGTSALIIPNPGDAGTSVPPSPKRIRPISGITGTPAPTSANPGDASTSTPRPGGVQSDMERPFTAPSSDDMDRELEELNALRDYDDFREMDKAIATQLVNRKFVTDQATANGKISRAREFFKQKKVLDTLWELVKFGGSRDDFLAGIKDAQDEVNAKYGGALRGYVAVQKMDTMLFTLLIRRTSAQAQNALNMFILATNLAGKEANIPIPEGEMLLQAVEDRIKQILLPQYRTLYTVHRRLLTARKNIATSPDTGVDIDDRLVNELLRLNNIGLTPQDVEKAKVIRKFVEIARWITMSELAVLTNKVAALSKLLENQIAQPYLLTENLIRSGKIETLEVVVHFGAYSKAQHESAIDIADEMKNVDALKILVKDDNSIRYWRSPKTPRLGVSQMSSRTPKPSQFSIL